MLLSALAPMASHTIVIDSTNRWVDVAQVLAGFGALIAAVLAYFGIRQAGALQAERTRERKRERLEDRLITLSDGIEVLVRLQEFARLGDGLGIARDQRRLRVAALRAGTAESSHEFEIVANFDYESGARQEFQSMCDGAMDKAVWEIGVLASEINSTFHS